MPVVFPDSASVPLSSQGVVVAIGNFDGVHCGHRGVLSVGKRLPGPLWVYTFEPAPTAVVAPERHQPRIMGLSERIARLGEAGVDAVVVEPFTPAFAARSAAWFATEVLQRRLRATGLVVGHDFRFGRGREGDAAGLRALLPQTHVEEVGAVMAEDGPVSSSRIRKLIQAGDVALAARLLGRPHRLTGRVVIGDQRGRTMGFPTANIGGAVELLPAYGVYAVRLGIDGRWLPGVMNIGVRPTFAGQRVSLEVHVLDFHGDLYGRVVSVELIERLRGEQRFSGIDELIARIQQDVRAARGVLSAGQAQ